MAVKTKVSQYSVKTTKIPKSVNNKKLMEKTISNLTDIVSRLDSTVSLLENDIKRIKIRMGI